VRRSQKPKKGSQVISHFALLGSTSIEAALKHVDEIKPEKVTQSTFVRKMSV